MRPLVLITFLGLFITFSIPSKQEISLPLPSTGLTQVNYKEGTNANRKLAWFDQMHRTAPGVNWRQIEQQNRTRSIQHKEQLSNLRSANICQSESFAQDQIIATWKERGSNNQAGSIYEVNYLASRDELWAIAAGGSLWKRGRLKDNWEVVNQDYRLNRGFLAFSEKDEEVRLLSFINNWLHYSDDDGLNWVGTNTNKVVDTYEGYFNHAIQTDGPKQLIAYFAKPSYYSDIQLFISQDQGATIESMGLFRTFRFEDLDLVSLPGSDEIYLLYNSPFERIEIYRLNIELKKIERLNTGTRYNIGDRSTISQITQVGDSTRIYLLKKEENIENPRLIYTSNFGKTWREVSYLPFNPWDNTFYISPKNSDIMYLGAIDAYRSENGGKNWNIINHWWQYYDNVRNFLHADIMYAQAFETLEEESFEIISHHGGINISYDNFKSQENLSLRNLNVGEYYSVRSNPNNPDIIYAGSQDQGLQTSLDTQIDSTLSFEQIISGDYGHLVYTNNYQSLWAVYPGGWIYYVADVTQGIVTASYELEAIDESVWLSPIQASPSTSDDVIYMAGGNPDGGPGSFIIELRHDNGSIHPKKLPFDFKEEAIDGTISAIAMRPEHPNHWYVATTNGRFFYSTDRGLNWEQNRNFIPQGNYLYGQAVEVSKYDPSHVYLAGSGYSNPAVFYSEDGGQTFVDMNEGLPPTLVYDLAFNEQESLLFAASEAGPFVYVFQDQRWYNLLGACTPNQIFWSVEYIPSKDLVRFGTYGRGIWDFQIEGFNQTANYSRKQIENIAVFPNPSNRFFSLTLKEDSPYTVHSINGQLIQQGILQAGQNNLDLSGNSPGTYLLRIQEKNQLRIGRLVLTR